ncbi:MAG: MlaD family protein [Gammaproteobacteria bacterium]
MAIVFLIVIVFLMTGEVGLFSGNIRITTYVNDAAGLRPGGIVNLSGVRVGNVTGVTLAAHPPDPKLPVRVDMSVASDQQAWLRTDSIAELGAVNPLGETMVNISRGTLTAPPATTGTVLRSQVATGISELMVSTHSVLQNANDIVQRLGSLLDQIQNGQGSVGKLIYSEQLYDRFNAIAKNVQSLTNQLASGQGTIGKLAYSDEFYTKLNTTLDRLNDTLNRIQSGNGTMAKLMNDPSLYNNANRLVSHLDETATTINSGQGTIGMLLKDRAMANKLRDTTTRVDALVTGLQEGKGTIGQLMVNPALYNQTQSLASELHEMVKAFREHPKKYLTIQLKLF